MRTNFNYLKEGILESFWVNEDYWVDLMLYTGECSRIMSILRYNKTISTLVRGHFPIITAIQNSNGFF